MILSKLHLENFKRYRNFEVTFGEGLTGIIGKNGSGKSTIFEAILFALYGEFRNKGYKEIVRNAHATTKDAVLVELTFEFEGMEYRVIREFRGKALSAGAKLYKNGELIASGAKEVTTAIIRLTKMNKEAFLHTLFASQKELTSLSTLKNEERKKMIRRLLGLEKIDFIEKELIEKSREIKREMAAFEQVLLSEEDKKAKKEQIETSQTLKKELREKETQQTKALEVIKTKETTLKKALDLLTKTKEQKQKLLSTCELIQNSIKSQSANQTKLQHDLKVLEEKAKAFETLKPIQKEYENLQKSLKEQQQLKEYSLQKEGLVKEQKGLREQYTKTKQDIKQLQKACEAEVALKEELAGLQKSLGGIKTALLEIESKEKALNASLSAEKRVLQDTQKKLDNLQKLGRESHCPTCTRPLLEAYDSVIGSLTQTIQETQESKIKSLLESLTNVEQEKKEVQAKKEQYEKASNDLSRQLGIIQSKQKDLVNLQAHFSQIEQKGKANNQAIEQLKQYVYDPKAHEAVQKAFEASTPKYEQCKSLETELKRLESVKQELAATQEKRKALESNYHDTYQSYEAIVYDATEHQQTQQEADTTAKEKERQAEELSRLKIERTKCEGEIKTIQSALDHDAMQQEKLKSKQEDLRAYEKIKTSLSAFKTKLNAKVAPRISDIASRMYAQITKGKYQHIEVSNDFDFFIYDEGKKYPIERFSGGEIDLANLVLRIAISRTLTELSGGSQVGFLAFDEVFGSQDEARRMEILEAFHTIKEQYRQIFLISHEMEIKEMFERVVEL